MEKFYETPSILENAEVLQMILFSTKLNTNCFVKLDKYTVFVGHKLKKLRINNLPLFGFSLSVLMLYCHYCYQINYKIIEEY